MVMMTAKVNKKRVILVLAALAAPHRPHLHSGKGRRRRKPGAVPGAARFRCHQ